MLMKRILLPSILSLISGSVMANSVVPETYINVTYPATYDAAKCDQTAFAGNITSLAIGNIPITLARSSFEKDPVHNRYSLVIELIQNSMIHTTPIRIAGEKITLDDIAKKLSYGQDVKLTEFKQCAESDKSLQLVELVNFNPGLKNQAPSMNATLEFVAKNDQGVCVVKNRKSLSDLFKQFNPTVDPAIIETSAVVQAGAISTSSGKLVGKDVLISFHKKDGSVDTNLKPTVLLSLPKDLSYTVIDRLTNPDAVLQMVGSPECKGERPDDPVWIYDVKVF